MFIYQIIKIICFDGFTKVIPFSLRIIGLILIKSCHTGIYSDTSNAFFLAVLLGRIMSLQTNLTYESSFVFSVNVRYAVIFTRYNFYIIHPTPYIIAIVTPSTTLFTALYSSCHTSRVSQVSQRSQMSAPSSRQATGANDPSVSRRIIPTV